MDIATPPQRNSPSRRAQRRSHRAAARGGTMDYGYSGDADRWQARRRIERRIERRLRWILVGGLVAIAILFAWETVEDRGLVPAPGIPAPFGDSQR